MALAGAVTEALDGSGVALIKGKMIVVDDIVGTGADAKAVDGFVARRKDAPLYSVEKKGDTIIVRSADPIAAERSRRELEVPPNLFKCPHCSFVTPYEELYVVHTRAHAFGV